MRCTHDLSDCAKVLNRDPPIYGFDAMAGESISNPNHCLWDNVVYGAPDVSDETRKATSDMLKDRLIGM
jgi:hypothetical protein